MVIRPLEASADELPDAKLFSHPGAYFHLSAPGMKAKGKVIENKSPQTKSNEAEWEYRSGFGTGNHPKGDQTIYWRFIKSTQFGDIYVITFEDIDHSITNVPIIYDGKKPVILERNAMRFEISESNISTEAEQAGTGQPATRPESKSEGGDKPQPEAEGRSR